MLHLTCSRCGLRIASGARYAVQDNCPRCLARTGVEVPLMGGPRFSRPAAEADEGLPAARLRVAPEEA